MLEVTLGNFLVDATIGVDEGKFHSCGPWIRQYMRHA